MKYFTTPIYYVNASPHLGHAFTTILADVYARYYREHSKEGAFFLTGTDEHGEKIQKIADEKGIPPKEFTDSISNEYKKAWGEIGISYDYFIRTTDKNHIDTVQKILQTTFDKGDIYFASYEGLYCVGCERYLQADELVDGKCPDHLKEPNKVNEQNYFFKMDKYREWLQEYIVSHPDLIKPERYKNEILNLIKEPIGDLCISRPKSRITWGIELPFDKNYVTYVWFDALINYISAIGYNGNANDEKFLEKWSSATHFMAKDIVKTHAIYWPTMLKSMGVPMMQNIVVHGFWKSEGQKMSKTIGNVVDPVEMKTKVGNDVFRYYVLKEMNFNGDSDFRFENLKTNYNADLANNWGNLLNRTQSMVEKSFSNVVPTPLGDKFNTDLDKVFIKEILDMARTAKIDFENYQPWKAIDTAFAMSRRANKYIDERTPWKLAKDESKKEELAEVLYNVFESIRLVASLLAPIMPETSVKVFEIFGLQVNKESCDLETFGVLKPQSFWNKVPPIYPRFE